MGSLICIFELGSRFEFGARETLGCDPSCRVGACGRRPSESADPGGSASWALYRAGIGCTVEKSSTGGGGWGLLGALRCQPRSSRWVVLSLENVEVRFGDGFGLRSMSKEAFGGLPEIFCELHGGPKSSKLGPILDRFEPRGTQIFS